MSSSRDRKIEQMACSILLRENCPDMGATARRTAIKRATVQAEQIAELEEVTGDHALPIILDDGHNSSCN